MLFTGSFALNLLCAIVPCQGTMRPPESYIANSNLNSVYLTDQFPSSAVGSFEAIGNNSLDPIEAHASASTSVLSTLTRPKRLQNDSEVSLNTRLNNVEVRQTIATTTPRYPNLANPLRTLMNAFRAGVEQAGGLTHNFGNRLIPFPVAAPGNVKRNAPEHEGSGRLNEKIVHLRNGDAVEGYYMGTMKGKRIMGFQGIPYAEAPLGNLRFRPPVAKRPWRGLLRTTRPGSECLQGHPVNIFRVSGSEDCLFLNIYTNQTSSSRGKGKLLPVIFFIHGGSFMYGSGSEYGPAYLVNQEVVLVTFNYRLGALGFMSTGDYHSSGNFGLKDQALALKWTFDNIEQFGGNSSKITIMGQSAGGVSAHIHLLANKTTHLFQSGISLSGSAFGFWPIVPKQRALGFTNRLARRLRCPQEDSAKLVQCLRNVRANYIIGAQLHFFTWIPFHPLIVFAPVVEPEGPDAFLTKSPEEIYSSGLVPQKPWIFGQTSQEGHFETYMVNLFVQTPILKARLKDLLPVVLDYQDFTSEPNTTRITEKIMSFYGTSSYQALENDSGKLMGLVSDMYTDRIFTNGIQKSIRTQSEIAPTYAYIFDYMGNYNLGQVFGAAKSEWGTVHTEDLFYFFNSSVFHDGFRRKDPEYKLSEIMTNLIANFAKYGEPLYTGGDNGQSVKIWDPAVKETSNIIGEQGNATDKRSTEKPIHYLRFKQVIEMIADPYVERTQFWKSLGIRL